MSSQFGPVVVAHMPQVHYQVQSAPPTMLLLSIPPCQPFEMRGRTGMVVPKSALAGAHYRSGSVCNLGDLDLILHYLDTTSWMIKLAQCESLSSKVVMRIKGGYKICHSEFLERRVGYKSWSFLFSQEEKMICLLIIKHFLKCYLLQPLKKMFYKRVGNSFYPLGLFVFCFSCYLCDELVKIMMSPYSDRRSIRSRVIL